MRCQIRSRSVLSCAALPRVVQREELGRLGKRGRLAALALALDVIAPLRPLQLLLLDRRELLGAHVRRRNAVVEPRPDRHHRLPREHALAEHLALRRPRVERDADLAPAVADQLEHVGLLGALACRVDDDLQRLAARASSASPVASRAVRPISSSSAFAAFNVELRPRIAVRLVEQRALRQHRVVRRLHEPEIDDLVDLVPVDPERQRAPEPDVAQQLAPGRVGRC